MTPPAQPALRIFVSHSHLDNEFGIKLVQDLRHVLADDSAVWYDEANSLYGGDSWWQKIVRELTTRNIFIVVLSPDAMNSKWVGREIDMALNEGKTIIPLLWHTCNIRSDLKILQTISFLPPKAYEDAFDELLVTLGLRAFLGTKKPSERTYDADTAFVQQMVPQIEAAFKEQDWPAVIRKVDYLLKRVPAPVTADIFRMQGGALYEEGEMQQAQEAFDIALALVSERPLRLATLHDYTTMLVAQGQWARALRHAKEALRLAPNDEHWLTIQREAQDRLTPANPYVVEKQAPIETMPQPQDQETSQKTKEQWLKEDDVHQDAELHESEEKIDGISRKNRRLLLSVWEPLPLVALTSLLALVGRVIDSTQLPVFLLLVLSLAVILAAYNRRVRHLFSRTYLLQETKAQWLREGDAHQDIGDYEEAIAAYDLAIALDPTYVDAYNNRGVAYHNLKQYERAILDYDETLRLDPKYAYAYNNRGVAYHNLKQYERAILDYDKALRLDPRYTLVYVNRGETYGTLKQYERATLDYGKAIRLNPRYTAAYINRAKTYHIMKQYQQALQDFDRAILRNRSDAWAYGSRGQVYVALKQYRRAIKDFDLALQLNPSLGWVEAERDEARRLLKGK